MVENIEFKISILFNTNLKIFFFKIKKLIFKNNIFYLILFYFLFKTSNYNYFIIIII